MKSIKLTTWLLKHRQVAWLAQRAIAILPTREPIIEGTSSHSYRGTY